jgi:curli biogenesis system outer membrane secretion channel CsgG
MAIRRTQILAYGAALAAAGCSAAHPTTTPSPQEADAAARAAIAVERSIDPTRIPDRAVGVPPMAITASDTTLSALGYGLSELLANDLARSSRLTVVERLRLEAVLRELDLARSGAVDTTTAARVGRIIGARRLIVGGVRQLPGGDVQITAQVADVVTHRVTNVVSARAPLSRIFEAETQLAFQIFNVLGVTLTPAERAAIEQAPTRNVAALLAYSRGVREESYGRYGAAAEQYRAALAADPNFTEASLRMTNVGGQVAASAPTTRRSTRAATSGNRAAQMAASNVNSSLADLMDGGAAAAIASNVATTGSPVQQRLFVTITIYIQPSR